VKVSDVCDRMEDVSVRNHSTKTYHLAEVASLDDDGDRGQVTLAEDLEETRLGHVDDDGLVILGFLSGLLGFSGDESPELLDVDGGAVGEGCLLVEPTHTDLTEPTGVELVEEDAVVVLTTSVTATTGVAAVLADTAMTSGDVATLLAGLQVVGHHDYLLKVEFVILSSFFERKEKTRTENKTC